MARNWRQSVLWLLVLGPLFFLCYGGSNYYASQLPLERVGQVAWQWERLIPLVPWTIVPYWSIDLMFAISLFLGRSRDEVRVQGQRLLLTTVLSCSIFMLWPLRFSFERPPVEGLFGPLFTALAGFDRPFNQAPSLHIGLLVVIWSCFRRYLTPRLKPLLDVWCLLIAVSVLTTWQHHLLDVPTGAMLGLLVCYGVPFPEQARAGGWSSTDPDAARRLALRYMLPGLLLVGMMLLVGDWAWLLLWPALALCLHAAAYAGGGPAIWQKTAGRYSLPSTLLLWPLRLPLCAVQAWYRRGGPPAEEIMDGVFIGPITCAADRKFSAVFDLTTEYAGRSCSAAEYVQLPLLDLLVPNQVELERAVQILGDLRLRHSGPVLVQCALGMTRSVAVVLAWLVHSGRVESFEQALLVMKQKRRTTILSQQALQVLRRFCEKGK